MVLEVSMRKDFDETLGEIDYIASSRKNVLMISIPIGKELLLISAIHFQSLKKLFQKQSKSLRIQKEKKMYKNILVSHAGSLAGDKALEHAAKIAKDNNSKITILHVVENIPIPPSLTLSLERKEITKNLAQARSELKREMYAKLETKAKKLRKQGIATSIKVLHGHPDEEIARIIENDHYDLLVMAKRKKLPGIKAILKLGSVSRNILEMVSCPVLLIDGERKQ